MKTDLINIQYFLFGTYLMKTDLLLISLVFLNVSWGADYHFFIDELPADEQSAIMALDEGTLDSAIWQKIRPFYEQPLVVPFGELHLLREIFSNLPSDLPISSSVLASYLPWKPDNIRIFFHDYPYLVPFQAILSFQTTKTMPLAQISIFSKVTGANHAPRQSARFSMFPLQQVQSTGTIELNDHGANLVKRRLLITLPFIGTIRIGNYNFNLNSGLFYGYFPSPSSELNSPKDNWIYGESSSWNGITCKTSIQKKVTLNTLLHTRKSESIVALKTNILLKKGFSLYGAFSGAISRLNTQVKDTSLAIHTGFSLGNNNFSLTLENGATLQSFSGIPLYLTLGYKTQDHQHKVTILRIPEKFFAPRSDLLQDFYSYFKTSDSLKSDITGLEIRSRGILFGPWYQSFRTTYLLMGHQALLKTTLKFALRNPFNLAFQYGLKISPLTQEVSQEYKNWSEIVPHNRLNINSYLSFLVNSVQDFRFSIYSFVRVKLFSSVYVSPHLKYIYKRCNENVLNVGIKQQIYLFEKTFGEFNCVVPLLPASDHKKYSFSAKTNFLF